jgi:predicted AAA+ superfamily ATPase
MIKREHYIAQIRPFYESDLIKVITGIRRCGKSVIECQIEDEIKSKGIPTLSLDFEDRAVSANITDADELIAYVKEHLTSKKLYVFLDEVQTLKDWNVACRSLRLENISLFITGSNSKLLSKEFTKELSGRYVSFCIRPFVYKEICEYASELNKKITPADYLIYGGFPKTIEFGTKDAVMRYLNELDEQIVMNDIMNRYKILKLIFFEDLLILCLFPIQEYSAQVLYKNILKGRILLVPSIQ